MFNVDEYKPKKVDLKKEERNAKIISLAYGTLLGLMWLFGETISYHLF